MSIFNLFSGNKPQNPQGPQPQQNNVGGSPHVQNNPTVPNASNSPQQIPTTENPTPESPVAKFGDLWKMEPTQTNQAPNFRIDPSQLQQVTSRMDFSQSVSRDDLAKISAGGQEAVDALMNVLNTVGRNVFSNAAQFSSHMTEQGYSTAQQVLDKSLPNLVKKQQTQNELFQANPKLRDPALQPLVLAIQGQIQAKFPNATPSEVNSMANQYFTEVVSKSFAPEQSSDPKAQQNENFNFASFLD